MRNIITLIIAVLPAYLIGLYVYNKDKDKESRKLLTKLFCFGMLSCFPGIILELLLGSFFGEPDTMNSIELFIYVVIGIAFAEEFVKWFVVRKVAYDSHEFDHVYDSIVYCVFVSLGFATLENIGYVFMGGITTGILRAICAVPGHAADAIIMANYIGLAKIADVNGNKSDMKKNMILSIIMPTFLHTIYDYCIFKANVLYLILFVFFLIFIYVYSIKKIKKLSNVTNNFKSNNRVKYCPKCGIVGVEEGNYCTNCGGILFLAEIKHDNT